MTALNSSPAAKDPALAAEAVRSLLKALGQDLESEGLRDTPERVARMLLELTSGEDVDPSSHLETSFAAEHDEMVMVRDIPLASLCEHHMIPFVGQAHVAYIPNEAGRITGLSKPVSYTHLTLPTNREV